MSSDAYKYAEPRPDVSDSAADLLGSPVLVARSVDTCVLKADRRR